MSIYDNIKVAALPLDIALADKYANIKAAQDLISNLPAGVDIAVLPELFNTGYSADEAQARSLAETNDGETINAIKDLARTCNMAIAGSFLAKEDGNLYNRAFFIEPNGDAAFYDKRHMFIVSEEYKFVSPGQRLSPVVRFRGWNITLAVCYDVRFPLWCRNTGLKYDLLLVPANWPEKRAYAWTHMLMARAIENQACVVGANRGGSDSFGVYDGQSYIYDFKGKSIGEDKGLAVVASLSKIELENFREKFPVWKSADDFDIIV